MAFIDEETHMLELYDTTDNTLSCMYTFSTLVPKKKRKIYLQEKFVGGQAYLVNASGFVLIYSVTDRSSFEALTGLKYVTSTPPLPPPPSSTTP